MKEYVALFHIFTFNITDKWLAITLARLSITCIGPRRATNQFGR